MQHLYKDAALMFAAIVCYAAHIQRMHAALFTVLLQLKKWILSRHLFVGLIPHGSCVAGVPEGMALTQVHPILVHLQKQLPCELPCEIIEPPPRDSDKISL